jgi:hypothetical protein
MTNNEIKVSLKFKTQLLLKKDDKIGVNEGKIREIKV